MDYNIYPLDGSDTTGFIANEEEQNLSFDFSATKFDVFGKKATHVARIESRISGTDLRIQNHDVTLEIICPTVCESSDMEFTSLNLLIIIAVVFTVLSTKFKDGKTSIQTIWLLISHN